ADRLVRPGASAGFQRPKRLPDVLESAGIGLDPAGLAGRKQKLDLAIEDQHLEPARFGQPFQAAQQLVLSQGQGILPPHAQGVVQQVDDALLWCNRGKEPWSARSGLACSARRTSQTGSPRTSLASWRTGMAWSGAGPVRLRRRFDRPG